MSKDMNKDMKKGHEKDMKKEHEGKRHDCVKHCIKL